MKSFLIACISALFISTLVSAQPTGNASYDYVAVGSGNAGMTVAVRLSEARHSVAMVEAGSFYGIGNGNLSDIPAYDTRSTLKSPADVNPLIDWGSSPDRKRQVCLKPSQSELLVLQGVLNSLCAWEVSWWLYFT